MFGRTKANKNAELAAQYSGELAKVHPMEEEYPAANLAVRLLESEYVGKQIWATAIDMLTTMDTQAFTESAARQRKVEAAVRVFQDVMAVAVVSNDDKTSLARLAQGQMTTDDFRQYVTDKLSPVNDPMRPTGSKVTPGSMPLG